MVEILMLEKPSAKFRLYNGILPCHSAEAAATSTVATVPPGHIHTQPGTKIVFNVPYDDKHTYHIKITNASGRRIGWAIKNTNVRCLGVDPVCGVLNLKETTLMAVSCNAFDYGREDTSNDRITVEWYNTSEGDVKQFRPEWF
ncbi:MSP domain protein [Oesophagostomum dentatum]|uniref:Major sperm protein n=1 Tax=Oesophagostomum dentatum TaxID=61180 RepID=A0A0B1SNP1_OESDE|nr:MSP domain protein [Oesophagostomum dentatum]